MTDWTTMTRRDFDRDAPEVQLTLKGMPVTDGHDTGDLLELLALDGSLS